MQAMITTSLSRVAAPMWQRADLTRLCCNAFRCAYYLHNRDTSRRNGAICLVLCGETLNSIWRHEYDVGIRSYPHPHWWKSEHQLMLFVRVYMQHMLSQSSSCVCFVFNNKEQIDGWHRPTDRQSETCKFNLQTDFVLRHKSERLCAGRWPSFFGRS
jgi:hypothetical protein